MYIFLQGFSRLARKIHAYEVSSIPTRIFTSKVSSNCRRFDYSADVNILVGIEETS